MKKFCFLFVAMMLVTCIGTKNVSADTYKVQSSIADDAVDTPLEDTIDFGTYWEPKCGVPNSSYGKIAADDGGNYIDLKGIYSFISYDEITSPSEFKIAFRAKEISANIGISFRAGSVFNLYEWDFHMEKGGQDGFSSMGATGIILSPIEGGLRVTIKTQDDNSTWGISSVFYDFMIEGIDYTKFVPIRIKDDGKTAELYVKDALLATVQMENEGAYETDENTEIFEYLDYVYYKTVSVKDASGNEVIKTDKARLVSNHFFAGAAVRDAQADFKDIALNFTTSGSDATATANITKSPEGTSSVTATPKTTSKTTIKPLPATDPVSHSDKDDGGNTLWIVFGICAAVVVAGAIVITVVVVKKKRK